MTTLLKAVNGRGREESVERRVLGCRNDDERSEPRAGVST
jgi:hypothetical protein